MRILVWAYLLTYFINFLEFNLIVFTLTIRDSILMILPFVGLKSMLSDVPFRRRITPIILLFSLVSFFSSVYILLTFQVPFILLVKRIVVQSFKHLLILFEVYIGFRLFWYIRPKQFVTLQMNLGIFFALLGLYQVLAHFSGLPYWGISTERAGIVAISDAGLRPNSLLGEPKEFAAYLTICLYLSYLLKAYKLAPVITNTFWITVYGYLWYLTQSGNGILSGVLIVSLSYVLSNINLYVKVFTGFLSAAFVVYFWENAENLAARPNHRSMITALKMGTLDQFVLLLDDLVRLPLMAFAKYTTMVFTGFGIGLLTFYANEFLIYAVWKSGGWIDSNISLLSSVSNYGLLFVLFLIFFMTSKFLAVRDRKTVSSWVNLTTKYLYYSFMIGFLVSGRQTALLFFAIGYIMSTTLPVEEQVPDEEDRLALEPEH